MITKSFVLYKTQIVQLIEPQTTTLTTQENRQVFEILFPFSNSFQILLSSTTFALSDHFNNA
jgi:hypothetical protein